MDKHYIGLIYTTTLRAKGHSIGALPSQSSFFFHFITEFFIFFFVFCLQPIREQEKPLITTRKWESKKGGNDWIWLGRRRLYVAYYTHQTHSVSYTRLCDVYRESSFLFSIFYFSVYWIYRRGPSSKLSSNAERRRKHWTSLAGPIVLFPLPSPSPQPWKGSENQ